MSDYGEAHWLLKNLQLWCAPPVIARDEAIFALCLCEARSNLCAFFARDEAIFAQVMRLLRFARNDKSARKDKDARNDWKSKAIFALSLRGKKQSMRSVFARYEAIFALCLC